MGERATADPPRSGNTVRLCFHDAKQDKGKCVLSFVKQKRFVFRTNLPPIANDRDAMDEALGSVVG
ncbi:hypothetical protein HDF16_003428 [Granulicella aggregans]|uniref:Uncharacterized protein n=1 Tax=Granulicella aggregans TaxID=474949 RepID=A0A7W8E4X9_9BACT|nr:hypothetical protein [Granulicella aggregans]MBB5058714.1 hypothetical protein [Granulicella aggregans]